MRYLKYALAAVMMIVGISVQAQHQHEPGPESGEQTRSWLELQRSGEQASETQQTVSGDVAAAIYQRFVDSFEHPIPEYYSGEEAGSATVGD